MKYLLIILILIIAVLAAFLIRQYREKVKYKKQLSMNNKHWECYVLLKKWLENRNQGKLLGDYFIKYPYKKIAIYGAGDLGKLLAYELKDTELEICFFIDRMAESLKQYEGIPVITINDIEKQPGIDAIIVTPLVDYDSVNIELIRKNVTVATVSLRDIIYEL